MLKYSTKHPETGYKIMENQQSKMTKLTTEELQDKGKELKEENQKLSLQVSDLWKLLSECLIPYDQSVIEVLIEERGKKYVKDIFKDDYEYYQRPTVLRERFMLHYRGPRRGSGNESD